MNALTNLWNRKRTFRYTCCNNLREHYYSQKSGHFFKINKISIKGKNIALDINLLVNTNAFVSRTIFTLCFLKR